MGIIIFIRNGNENLLLKNLCEKKMSFKSTKYMKKFKQKGWFQREIKNCLEFVTILIKNVLKR